MRYGDGPTVEVEIEIAAPVERVWDLVSDIDLPGRFSEEFQGAVWLDGASGPTVGARFKGRNHHPAIGEWETVSFVTACDPPRVFGWVVNDASNPASQWRFELESEGAGTRLRQWACLGPGPSGTSYEIELAPDQEDAIIERRLGEHQRNMQRVVEGVKRLAEAR